MRNTTLYKALLSTLVLSLFLSLTTYCQFYDGGQDKFRKLSLIKTNHFKIIYPSEYQSLGQLYANNLEQTYHLASQTLQWKPRRIPVVLYPSVAYSNGEVAWAPRRITMLTLPAVDNYRQLWDQQLTLHEFRHVVQSDMLNQKCTKFFNTLIGEQFTGLLLGVHVPYWFLEGDAVAYETGATQTGRGRISSFENQLAAQVAQKGIYSYSKAMFGSYADNVPSHYHLGYHLVAFGRLNYGCNIWTNAMNNVAQKPFTIRPFGKSIKNTTGLTEKQFYKTALSAIKTPPTALPQNATTITYPNAKDYTSHFMPQKFGNKIVTLRKQMSDIAAFVTIDTATSLQTIVTRPGAMSNTHFSAAQYTIVWNQLRYRRWDYNNHSQIVLFDGNTNKRKFIIKQGRYYNSTLSTDAQLIVSAHYTDSLQWYITIHSTDGKLIKQKSTPTFIHNSFACDSTNQNIAFIATHNNQRSIKLYNLKTNNISNVTQNIADDIKNITFIGTKLYFIGNYKNNDALYCYDTNTDSCYIAITAPYGVEYGNSINNSMLFTYYTADGYQVAKSHQTPTPATFPQTRETAFSQAFSQQEQQVCFSPDSTFKTKRYNRLTHLFNIHSWGPFAIDADNAEMGPGVTFMSQDALSTSFLTAGYQYYYSEMRDNYFAEYKYKGFYPILGIRGDIDKLNLTLTDERQNAHLFRITQRKLSTFILFPFVLKSDVFTTGTKVQALYQYHFTKYDDIDRPVSLSSDFQTLTYTFNAYTERRMAQRDLQPRWGANLRIDYQHHIATQQPNHYMAIQGAVMLPGLFKNHGITIYGGQETRNNTSIYTNSTMSFPRGCKAPFSSQTACLLTSYAFPVCYPDLCLGDIAYIKRLKAKLFCDFATSVYTNQTTKYQSIGTDITADFHIFRIIIPFTAGIRYAYLPNTKNNFLGILLSLNTSALRCR